MEVRIISETDARGVVRYYTQYLKSFFGYSYWAFAFVPTGMGGSSTSTHENLGGAKEALIQFKKKRCKTEVVYHDSGKED